MSENYILVGKETKQINDILEWAQHMETVNRIVEQTEIGDIKVSTVFLGLDHRYGDGEPLLFETMIFGGSEDGFQDRYSTWDEATKGHKRACALAKG